MLSFNDTNERRSTVILCGSTGFIGQRLARRLADQGVCVIAVGRGSRPGTVASGRWIELGAGEFRLPNADAIINLAGKAHAMREISAKEDEYNYANRDLPLVLARAGLAAGISKFIQISTVKVWSDKTVAYLSKADKPVDSSLIPDADTVYGRSKLLAEQELAKLPGISLTILRLSMVYGPGNKGNLPKLIAAAKSRLFPGLPRGCGRRSMVHVDDVVDAILLALAREVPPPRPLVITHPNPVGADTICDWVREELGRPPALIRMPRFMWRAIGAVGDLVEFVFRVRPPVNTEAIDRILSPYVVDAAEAREKMGFIAKRDLRQFVSDCVNNR